jgi:arsenate reductase
MDGVRSKSWEEFTRPEPPHLSFVLTVSDTAAKEVCPVWPGQPMTAPWGVPDHAVVEGTPEEIERAYKQAFAILNTRISLMLALPLSSLDSLASRRKSTALDSIRSIAMNEHNPQHDLLETRCTR